MKKIFLFITLVAMTMVGCKQNGNRVYSETAAQGISGTYKGQWTQTDDKGVATTVDGTAIFEVVEGQTYAALLKVEAAGLDLKAQTMVNVSHAEDDYVYYNSSAMELLPADNFTDGDFRKGFKEGLDPIPTVPSLQGTVTAKGETTFSYTLKTGKGKKAKNVVYTFVGAR